MFIKKALILSFFSLLIISCQEQKMENKVEVQKDVESPISIKRKQYADVHIKSDLSKLTQRQQDMVAKLCEAGKLADKIFWLQNNHDGISVRDSLSKIDTPEAKEYLEFVNINYGPYDPMDDNKRFVGNGPDVRPKTGAFYPQDMTKEEFETAIKKNPKLEKQFTSLYTVIARDSNGLAPIPYSKYYNDIEQLVQKLDEAAELCDNPSFKKYLILRAKGLRTNDYYESDLAWMDIKDSDVDLVIGPIENYQDELFNYKAAFEAVVMVKDPVASQELEVYKNNMQNFESRLPIDDKYKQKNINAGNLIQVVNVVYFGGDCQQAVKTIAAALPNDPKVAEKKGRKLSMYKNFMEAKFDIIVNPIGKILLSDEYSKNVDKKAFTSFVTLHEVSHALGPKYVFGTKKEIREALKDKYSGIEECKADILSMYNHIYLREIGVYDDNYIEKAKATYLAGLYRSIRFGTGAHAASNYIQLNFLRDKKAIYKDNNGKFVIDSNIFFDAVKELANIILTIQYEGNYQKATELIDKYGKITNDIQQEINLLKDIPRDINTTYDY